MIRFVALGIAGLALGAPGAASTGASLRLASVKPLVVKGSDFKGRERVVVTLTVQRHRVVRRVTATPAGSFTAGFGVVQLGRCPSFTVRAAGLEGSVAILRRLPLPACIPFKSP